MDGILWCAQTITPVYPRFRFQRLDIAHPLYNPKGSLPGTEVQFGFANGSFDFITMVSVATHLPPEELTVYLNEARACSRRAGGCSSPPSPSTARLTGQERLAFKRWQDGPGWYAIEERAARRRRHRRRVPAGGDAEGGLLVESLRPGHWRGISAAHYQDLLIATKPERSR